MMDGGWWMVGGAWCMVGSVVHDADMGNNVVKMYGREGMIIVIGTMKCLVGIDVSNKKFKLSNMSQDKQHFVNMS